MAKRLIIFLFLVILGGFFVSRGIKLGKSIKNSPFWYFKRVNFILLGDKSASVFSFEGSESKLMEFPFQEKIDLPRGFGQYELGKIYQLGELEKRGGQLFLETFQKSLNLPVLGYFYQDEFGTENYRLPRGFQKIINQSMKKKVKTNFKLSDLFILYFRTRKISPLSFKKEDYQNGINDFFKDEKIREEALAVEILNGTSHQGLAQKGAELWENLGGRVIRVADYSEKLPKSLLITKGESNKSYSYKIMKYFFNSDDRDLKGEEDRADMTLILGEDYWKNMVEKW